MGWIAKNEPIVMQLYSEEMQKFRLAGEGFGKKIPPDHLKERIKNILIQSLLGINHSKKN